MKKVLVMIVTAFTLCFSVPRVFAESTSWYFKPAQNGAQPQCCPEMAAFVKENGGIFLGSPDDKKIYLTFDAGYENGNVERILDVLKKHNAPAAFFVLPQIIKENTELVMRMKNEGHLICNHSRSHRDMSKVTDFETFKKELNDAEKVLYNITGFEMDKYYRPPQGNFSRQNITDAASLGYKTVFWSLAYADWDDKNQMDTQKALQLVKERTHNGAVVLLHPTSSTNAAILDDYITQTKQAGYEFCSLSDFN